MESRTNKQYFVIVLLICGLLYTSFNLTPTVYVPKTSYMTRNSSIGDIYHRIRSLATKYLNETGIGSDIIALASQPWLSEVKNATAVYKEEDSIYNESSVTPTRKPIDLQLEDKVEFKDLKKILYYTDCYGNWHYGAQAVGREAFKNLGCPEQRCFVTANRSLMRIDQFDALVFHPRANSFGIRNLPKLRSPHQRYVMWLIESGCYPSRHLRE